MALMWHTLPDSVAYTGYSILAIPGVFNLGYAYPWGYVGSFQGVREHHCRICIILLEKVGVDCMWSAEPIGDVHFTAS